jgi:hypothetical protein
MKSLDARGDGWSAASARTQSRQRAEQKRLGAEPRRSAEGAKITDSSPRTAWQKEQESCCFAVRLPTGSGERRTPTASNITTFLETADDVFVRPSGGEERRAGRRSDDPHHSHSRVDARRWRGSLDQFRQDLQRVCGHRYRVVRSSATSRGATAPSASTPRALSACFLSSRFCCFLARFSLSACSRSILALVVWRLLAAIQLLSARYASVERPSAARQSVLHARLHQIGAIGPRSPKRPRAQRIAARRPERRWSPRDPSRPRAARTARAHPRAAT